MNTVERDKEKEYKEWCEKNQDFLKRYVSEFLNENKDNIEKVINEHIESEIKKCLSRMTKEEWEKILIGPLSGDIRYCIDMVLPKAIEDLLFMNKDRARVMPDYVKDYGVPRYRGYSAF